MTQRREKVTFVKMLRALIESELVDRSKGIFYQYKNRDGVLNSPRRITRLNSHQINYDILRWDLSVDERFERAYTKTFMSGYEVTKVVLLRDPKNFRKQYPCFFLEEKW